MTPNQMAECAAAGQFWWMRPDGTFYATAEQEPASPDDTYLLNATPEWAAQWGSWKHATQVMAPLFERLNEFRT